MRSSLFVTVLALALSTAAVAQDRDRYRYDDRYQERYGNQNNRVDVIAREIAETAAAMRREYDRNNRRPDRDEARVSAALQELHEEAYQFARYSGSYRRDSRRNQGYDGLMRAFDHTARSLDYINRRPYVDRGMDRIWNLMSQLDRYHGGRSNRYDRGWNSRDWNQRDRYDRYRN